MKGISDMDPCQKGKAYGDGRLVVALATYVGSTLLKTLAPYLFLGRLSLEGALSFSSPFPFLFVGLGLGSLISFGVSAEVASVSGSRNAFDFLS